VLGPVANDHAPAAARPAAVRSIALTGPLATRAGTGGGGSSAVFPASTVDLGAGLRNRVRARR
jgi:beta-glucosidase